MAQGLWPAESDSSGEAARKSRQSVVMVLIQDAGMTKRQADVAYRVVVCGSTVNGAAKALGVHPSTVKCHLDAIRQRRDLSQAGLIRLVCASIYGELDGTAIQANGSLCVRAMTDRLGLPSHLAETMQLLWDGKSSKEIANALSVSVHTAANYRRRLRRRMHVRSSVQLLRAVYRELARNGR